MSSAKCLNDKENSLIEQEEKHGTSIVRQIGLQVPVIGMTEHAASGDPLWFGSEERALIARLAER